MSIKTVHQIRSTRTDSQFNFSEKQIVSIVEEVCNGLTRKEACIKYGIAYGTIGQWMKRYNPGVSDITYIRLISGFIYLSLITDAYSKKVVGFNLHKTLATEGCITALQMALENRINKHLPLIHHSDRGCQYCCKEYVDLLCQNNIAISMTNNGDPYENAIAERLNGILKTEFNLYSSQFNYEQTSW